MTTNRALYREAEPSRFIFSLNTHLQTSARSLGGKENGTKSYSSQEHYTHHIHELRLLVLARSVIDIREDDFWFVDTIALPIIGYMLTCGEGKDEVAGIIALGKRGLMIIPVVRKNLNEQEETETRFRRRSKSRTRIDRCTYGWNQTSQNLTKLWESLKKTVSYF